jgi:hypothetical protein
MIQPRRILHTLAALSMAGFLVLATQGCDSTTSSTSDTTGGGGNSVGKGSDTLTSDSLARGGTFAKAGATYYIVGGEISGDLVFGRKLTIVVLGTPHVTGSLTFDEGDSVLFESGTYLDITSGRLSVLGSDSLPVVLKNRKAGKYWGYGTSSDYSGGIFFSSDANPLSAIRHAIVDSANTGIYTAVDGIEITNSVFKHAKGYGVMFSGSTTGPLAGFSNDSFAVNAGGPFRLSSSQLTRLDGTQKFAAGELPVQVDGATAGISGTWPALTVPYEFLSVPKISSSSGVVIHIAAGAHLVFDQGTYLDVEASGTLKVDGTAAKPVVMGPAQTGKRWGYGSYDDYSGGIWIGSQASGNTAIKHLLLDSANTGIYVGVGGVKIDSSTISNSQYQSIRFAGFSVPGSLAGNTYSGNGEYSLRLGFNGLTALDGSGTFAGSNSNVLVEATTASASGTVPALPVPYEIAGAATVSNASGVVLQIAAGTHFVFQEGAYLDVGTSAALKVNGTLDKPVLFGPAQTGKTWGYGSSDDYSGGIWLEPGSSNQTSIAHLVLDSANTGIYVGVSGVRIDTSTFENNTFQGIRFASHIVPASLGMNSFQANGEYSMRMPFDALAHYDGSGFFGGSHMNVLVEAGSIVSGGTISPIQAQQGAAGPLPTPWYVVDGVATVGGTAQASTVQIGPGTTLKFTAGSYIDVQDNGAVVAVGTTNQPIYFENAVSGTTWGYGSDPTYCGGIFLNSASSNASHISNSVFQGVVNDVPVYVAPSLTGVVVSNNTVSPGS